MRLCPTRRQILLAMGAATLAQHTARAQASWPERELRIVVPLPAGGGVDLFVRALADRLRASLGRPVLIDNKPGAGGMIASKLVAQAPADGYTLAYVHSGLVTLQAMNPRLDLLKDFRLVARLTHSPFALVVPAASPYRTAQELVAAVQAAPDKLSYGSAGLGSPPHLAVELISERLGGFKALHVPYKGALEIANAMVGGQVDFSIALVGPLLPLVQSGKLRLLAVTSRRRLAQAPQVPTLDEAAVPGFVMEPWGGLVAPNGTPDAVIERLTRALTEAMASSEIKEITARQASVIEVYDGNAFTAQLQKDIPAERTLVKRLGMTAE